MYAVKAYRGFESHPLRQLLSRQRSPPPSGTAENPNIRAVHAPKLLTERTAPEPEFVSLRPVFSKPPDFGKTVRIFKRLICRHYSTLGFRAFRISLGPRETIESKCPAVLPAGTPGAYADNRCQTQFAGTTPMLNQFGSLKLSSRRLEALEAQRKSVAIRPILVAARQVDGSAVQSL